MIYAHISSSFSQHADNLDFGMEIGLEWHEDKTELAKNGSICFLYQVDQLRDDYVKR